MEHNNNNIAIRGDIITPLLGNFIPEDVLFNEILPRLPVEALGRFKAVAKQWNSIISSHAFHNQHLTFRRLSRNKRTSTFIIEKTLNSDSYLSERSLFLLRVNNNMEESIPNISKELKHGYEQDIIDHELSDIVIGSCNGLICVHFLYFLTDETTRQFFMIWNPTTNQKRLIDGPPHIKEQLQNVCYGFAYDSSSDDYKIVFISGSHLPPDTILTNPCGYLYTLKTQQWTKLDVSSLPLLDYNHLVYSVLVDGTLYWLLGDYRTGWTGWNMVAFDSAKESFFVVPLPPLDYTKVDLNTRRRRDLYPCNIKDCLCICWWQKTNSIADDNGNYSYEMEVWVLEDSWKMLSNLNFSAKIPLHRYSRPAILDTPMKSTICFQRGHLLWIDSNLPRLVHDDSSGRVSIAFEYVESLISPDSYYRRSQGSNVMSDLISSIRIEE